MSQVLRTLVAASVLAHLLCGCCGHEAHAETGLGSAPHGCICDDHHESSVPRQGHTDRHVAPHPSPCGDACVGCGHSSEPPACEHTKCRWVGSAGPTGGELIGLLAAADGLPRVVLPLPAATPTLAVNGLVTAGGFAPPVRAHLAKCVLLI